MNPIIELLVFVGICLSIFIIIELIIRNIILSVNRNFQWLIVKKDEKPKLSKSGLEKFFKHGYDSELGWVRKPFTEHEENGKTKWHIDKNGARENPVSGYKEGKISCYGDSFTFARQVNDNETWGYYLSELTKTNIQNFGVGNYGLDQSLLRLKREFEKNPTEIVILGVVPDTLSRILSVWKHYYEYGNTFGFKPKFEVVNENLRLLKNPIDEEEKFLDYQKFLEHIQSNDYFYKNKFLKEIIRFPYCFSILRNLKRNYEIIKGVRKNNQLKLKNQEKSEITWKPMSVIMKINLEWRIKLFKQTHTFVLFNKILEEYVNYSKEKNFKPIFIFLPQKDDLLFIREKYHFFEKFINKINKSQDLIFIDITKKLILEDDLKEFFSDNNDYGGHYSSEGNKKIAKLIFAELKNKKLI